MSDKIGSVLYVADGQPQQEMKQLIVGTRTVFPVAFDSGLQCWWNDPLLSLITKGLGSQQRLNDQIYVYRVTARTLSKHRWQDDYSGAPANYQPCYWQHDLFLKTDYHPTFATFSKMNPAEIYAIPEDVDPSSMGPLVPLALERCVAAAADEKYSLLRSNYTTRPPYVGGQTAYETPLLPGLPQLTAFKGDQTFGSGPCAISEFKTDVFEFEFCEPMLVKYNPTLEEEYGIPVPDRELFLNQMMCMPGVKLEDIWSVAALENVIQVSVVYSDVPILPDAIRENPAAVVDDEDFYAAQDERPEERSDEEAGLKRDRAGRLVYWRSVENKRPRKRKKRSFL